MSEEKVEIIGLTEEDRRSISIKIGEKLGSVERELADYKEICINCCGGCDRYPKKPECGECSDGPYRAHLNSNYEALLRLYFHIRTDRLTQSDLHTWFDV